MSIQSEIDRIEQAVSDTYDVLEAEGAAMPEARTVGNLAATAADIKAVLYGKEQNLTDAEKQQARENIGVAGSGFSGSYNDLTDVPSEFPPADHDASKVTSGTFAAARIPSLAASKITAGTFAGAVVANSAGQDPGTSLVRNSRLVAEDTTPTVNGEIFWTYG